MLKKILKLVLTIEILLQLVSFGRYIYLRRQINKSQINEISSNWFLSMEKNLWWTNETRNLYSEYHPFLGWRFRPTASSKRINISADGQRKTIGNPPEYNDFLNNIYFLGGSTMAGYYVSDEETIPSYVAQLLNHKYSNNYIYNYGNFAYNNNQELILLIMLLKNSSNIETVIFYDGCNELFTKIKYPYSQEIFYERDMSQLIGNIRLLNDSNKTNNLSIFNLSLLKELFKNNYKYIKLIYYPSKLFGIYKDDEKLNVMNVYEEEDIEKLATEISENYYKNSLIVSKLAENYDFKYFFLWQPLIYNKPLTEQEMVLLNDRATSLKEIYKRTTQKLKDKNITNYYDISDIFKDLTNQSIFFDQCHISQTGNRIISEKIIQLLNITN